MEGRMFLKQRIYIIASKTVRLSIQDVFSQPSCKLYNCRKIYGCKILALTGDTPASYILRIKMQKARQLLESKPGMTVEEIAEKCGFEHVSSFYHSFKRMHGTTRGRNVIEKM